MLQMCSFDGSKSTKGASKLRRDLINTEIANLRDLLPLPSSTRQRLSQLQLMALVCVYVRKSNYFQQVFRKLEGHDLSIPNFGFSKAMSGFLMMMTQNGKLLYISDNAAEYLGHSMEDLLIHGDSVYDIIDKQDHAAVQAEMLRGGSHHNPSVVAPAWEKRMFLCRMNVSRNARRQMRFGDQKVVLIRGHFLSFLPLCSRNEPVFLATCTPVAMPETRECVVQGTTAIFTSLHSMDMKFIHIDTNGEYHLGLSGEAIQGSSWYQMLHWEHLKEAQHKHRMITQAEADRACIMLVRMQSHHQPSSAHRWLWIHVVLQVKDSMEGVQHPVIVCTNQVLSDKEAEVMKNNTWLYHYYSINNKLHYVEGQSAPTYAPPPPPVSLPAPPSHLLLSYPITVPEAIHHRHQTPNGGGGGGGGVQQRHSAHLYNNNNNNSSSNNEPSYTRLDNRWSYLHMTGSRSVDGGGGTALVTQLVHTRQTLSVRGKWRVNEWDEDEEEQEVVVASPQQIVPDINGYKCVTVSSPSAVHVPEYCVDSRRSCSPFDGQNNSSSDGGTRWLPETDSVVMVVGSRRCLCNINTCLALCTCGRFTSGDSEWTFCCTSTSAKCFSADEEEEEVEEEDAETSDRETDVEKRRRHRKKA